MGPMPDQAQQFAVDELSINLDLVESDTDQTLGGRVWIKFRLPNWQVSYAGQEMWNSKKGGISGESCNS